MRRKSALGIAGAGVIATVALAGGATGRQAPSTITLRATSELEHVHLIDDPPAGRSAGDVLIFTEKLLGRNGHVIGHDAASCRFLFDARSLCTGAYVLPGGQIMIQLVQPSLSGAITYNQAITGGTGRYTGASGRVTVNQKVSGGDSFTFHIRRPGASGGG